MRTVPRLLLLVALTACSSAGSGVAPDTTPALDAPVTRPETACAPGAVAPDSAWYREAVFYEVFVRSFRDADGDGIGDLAGLTEKLDYLNDGDPTTDTDLGVTALWLMPITSAGSYHGYDTVDYRAVEPDYGDLDDLRALVTAAHARGIRVVMDLVLNHSSDQHPWFVDSATGPEAEYRDYYLWRDESPFWQRPWSGGGPTWHKKNDAFYYGVFWKGMPDLNYTNPAVRAEAIAISRHWLDLGLDGFRLDAVRYLIETGEGEGQADTPETHAFWKEYRAALAESHPEALLVGEAWTERSGMVEYFGTGDELHMAFDFDLQQAIQVGIDAGSPAMVHETLCGVFTDYPAVAQDATFLSNHDQFRIATALDREPRKLRLAAAVLLTLPGTPFLYYGEEIGLPNGPEPKDEHKRQPMRWDATPMAGFTTADAAWEAPFTGDDAPDVAAQAADSASLLAHYRQLVRLRLAHAALRSGQSELVPREWVSETAVLGFLRQAGDERVLVLHNFGATDATDLTVRLAGLTLAPSGTGTPEVLWGGVAATLGADRTVTIDRLAAGGSAVVRL